MKINLNGEPVVLNCRTLMELVRERGLDESSLIVEHNLKIVAQESWENTVIHDGDTIELLSFVGGG